MILKLTNKSKNFYTHLGKVFGSRKVERVTHDRIYDDDNKEWYIYYSKGNPAAFVSVTNNVIKNIWSENEDYLVEILIKIKDEIKLQESIVTVAFKELYQKAGYTVSDEYTKNFIKIRSEQVEKD